MRPGDPPALRLEPENEAGDPPARSVEHDNKAGDPPAEGVEPVCMAGSPAGQVGSAVTFKPSTLHKGVGEIPGRPPAYDCACSRNVLVSDDAALEGNRVMPRAITVN